MNTVGVIAMLFLIGVVSGFAGGLGFAYVLMKVGVKLIDRKMQDVFSLIEEHDTTSR